MENFKYQQAFRYVGALLYSVFAGLLVSFLMRMIHGVLLYPSYYFEIPGFHIPEFITLAGFFLGGILAPWLISLFFGVVDKKIMITSYFFTTLITIFNIMLIVNSVELEGYGNSWSLLFYFVSSLSIIPVLILSHLFLYLSYKRRTSLPATESSTEFHPENQQDRPIFHRFTFRCIGVVSFSLFLGSFFGLLFIQFFNVIPWILQIDDFNGFSLSATFFLYLGAFFLGGVLAPRAISFFFGAVDRKIALVSHGIITFLAVTLFFLFFMRENALFVDDWAFLVFSGVLIPFFFVLSHIFLYLSYKKATPITTLANK